MASEITDGEAIEAAWDVQLPHMRIDLPIGRDDGFERLYAARGDRAYADMGVWLGLCSLASTIKGHVLPLDHAKLAEWLFGTAGKSTVAADHVNALAAAGLVSATEDGWLYLPAIETEMIRHGKQIVGGSRGGRPRGKRKRRHRS